jgi:hypothetical protein
MEGTVTDRTLADEMMVRLAAIKADAILLPKIQRHPVNPILGRADDYLKRLYTLSQYMEDQMGRLNGRLMELESRMEDESAQAELSVLNEQLQFENTLLCVVETHLNHEARIRNPQLRDCPWFEIFDDWTFAESSNGEPAGARPRKDPAETLSEFLTKASDGVSTLQ